METTNDQTIPYPRFSARRKILAALGKGLLRLLTRPTILGLENIPDVGPVILAGNHVSTFEPMFMFLFPRQIVEPTGAGDIPFEGLIDLIVRFYGFIPINRGNLDRKFINQALSVLNQKGYLGIFPEGGTWDPGNMKAQVGVAWLSHKGQAAVVPVGFSGFHGGMKDAFKLKRPKLTMKVGQPIPALNPETDDRPLKVVYQEYADMVLERINELIDPQEFLLNPNKSEYNLRIHIGDDRRDVMIPGQEELAHFLFSPVILETLLINLKKPVKALFPEQHRRSMQGFIHALSALIETLKVNPGFLTYRMGMEKGKQVEHAIQSLIDLLEEAKQSGKSVQLEARARHSYPDGRIEEKIGQYDLRVHPGR